MATNKPLSYHQIASKFRSKSSDSIINLKKKNEPEEKRAKQVDKATKMKKSQTVFAGFESKPLQQTSALRRRFSLFRFKRSLQSTETCDVQVLQQIIDQLRTDLRTKTNELEVIGNQQPPSIKQALQLQRILNRKLEEMLRENNLLKKSIAELESFAQQQKSKRGISSIFIDD